MGTTGTCARRLSEHPFRVARLRRWACLAIVMAVTLGIAPVATGAVCASTPAGLIARWPGDGSTAEVAHGRNGTLLGDATYGAGEVDQAFSFDGAGDTVSAPYDPDWTLGDFTIDTWVNMADVGGESKVFVGQSQGQVAPKWLFWRRDDGQLGFLYGDGSWGVDAVMYPWTPTLGQWYHVAVTRSGSTFTLYVDGTEVATAEVTQPIVDNAGPLTLGGAQNEFHLNGLLDEPEIFQRALSAAEIDAIHDQGGAARCAVTRSTVTLDADATGFPGETLSLQGALSLSGGASVENLPIELSRSVDGGAWAAVAALTTGPAGAFSFDDAPPEGTVRYRATFPGAPDVSAGNGWTTVAVGKGTSVLTLSLTKTKITYGAHVKVTAHLEGGSSNRVVAIHAVQGGQDKTIRTDRVNHESELSVRAAPSATTTYYATYAGDPQWEADTSPSRTVRVAARWTVKTVGGYATRSGVRLYHYSPTCDRGTSTGCPTAVFTLGPNHAGERVSFEGKYCRDGRCFKDTARFRLNRRSRASIYISYGDRTVIGWTLSFRLTFGGDADHVGSTSAWAQTKVTS